MSATITISPITSPHHAYQSYYANYSHTNYCYSVCLILCLTSLITTTINACHHH